MVKRIKKCITSLHSEKGFVFLEILIAITLIIVAFVGMLGMAFSTIQTSSNIKIRNQIDALLKEELEAARNFRDGTVWNTNGLNSLVNYGNSYPYYFTLDNSNPPQWIINAGTETVGSYTRHLIIDKVMRDANGDLVTFVPEKRGLFERFFASQTAYALACPEGWVDPCMFDSNMYKLTAKVFYQGTTYQVVTYLTNWRQ